MFEPKPDPKPDPMIARDLVGYGETPPHPRWPDGALIAVNFNLNVEGGGESTLSNGDEESEGMLNDIGVPTQRGRRVPLVESVFEYGRRPRARAKSGSRPGRRRAGPRDRQPRLPLDRLRRRRRRDRARAYPARRRDF